ncbi:MAG: hypothetical protein ABH885_00195, partial [Candidatus Omnitrophota bacterium]
NLMPELSFGTHFFQDLVETNIFYVALFPDKEGVVFNRRWFARVKDVFPEIMPQSARFEGVISVYDTGGTGLRIMSDIVSQKIMCFFNGT